MARMVDGVLSRKIDWAGAGIALIVGFWGMLALVSGLLILYSDFILGISLLFAGGILLIILLPESLSRMKVESTLESDKGPEPPIPEEIQNLTEMVQTLTRIMHEYMEIVEDDRNQLWDYILTKRRD